MDGVHICISSAHFTRVPHPCYCMPLCSLPAVGPPLLTLVNFEVENLAYMLVCMQWTVSGTARDHKHMAFWERASGDDHFRRHTQDCPPLSVNGRMCVCKKRIGTLWVSSVKGLPPRGENPWTDCQASVSQARAGSPPWSALTDDKAGSLSFYSAMKAEAQ